MNQRITPTRQSGKRIHPHTVRSGEIISQETKVFSGELPGEFVIDVAASVGSAAKNGNSLTTGVTPDKLAPFMREMAQFALMYYDRTSVATIFRDTDSGTFNDMVESIGSVRDKSQVPHKELIIVGSVDPLVNVVGDEPSTSEVLSIDKLTKMLEEPARTGGEYSPSIAIVTERLVMDGVSLANRSELLAAFGARTRSFAGVDASQSTVSI